MNLNGPVPIMPTSGVPTFAPFASTNACEVTAAAFVAAANCQTASGLGELDGDFERPGRIDARDPLVERGEVGADVGIPMAVEAERDVLGGQLAPVMEEDAGTQGVDVRERIDLLPRLGQVRLELRPPARSGAAARRYWWSRRSC